MKNEYQKEFMQFLSEVKLIQEAERATYELSHEILNSVVLSGEVVGKDTREKIDKIGKKYGLLVMANELSVVFRESDIR